MSPSSFSLANCSNSLVEFSFLLFNLIFFVGILIDAWLLSLLFPIGLAFLNTNFEMSECSLKIKKIEA